MLKKLRLTTLALLLLVLLAGYLLLVKPATVRKSTLSPPPATEEAKKEIALVLDFGGGKVATYSIIPSGSTTVYGLLERVADEEGIGLETQQYDFGIFVKSINGKESSTERAWIYFVNGQSADVAADKYDVKGGDLIEWKYIEPSY